MANNPSRVGNIAHPSAVQAPTDEVPTNTEAVTTATALATLGERAGYAPHEVSLLTRTVVPLAEATTEASQLLVGEDRSFGGQELFVDLIPRSCWFTNVRTCVHPADWDRLRHRVYQRANNQCECCQASGVVLEAHERWRYDEESKTQKLMRLIALCHACHETTHMGLAQIRGRGESAKQHLINVTKMSEDEATRHIAAAFAVWRRRNAFTWELDLSIITDSGIRLKQRPDGLERRRIGEAVSSGASDTRAFVDRPAKHARLEPSGPQQ